MQEAFKSQLSASYNSGRTLTYSQCSEKLLKHLGLCKDVISNQVLNKYARKKLNAKNRCALQKLFGNTYFNALNKSVENNSGKLLLYSKIKTAFNYEKYLDHKNSVALTNIRLSNHHFPIERGRYTIPITPRDNRVCELCNCDTIGDEVHCMLTCSSNDIQMVSNELGQYLITISQGFTHFLNSPELLFYYLIKGHEDILLPKIIEWCHKCNQIYKQNVN